MRQAFLILFATALSAQILSPSLTQTQTNLFTKVFGNVCPTKATESEVKGRIDALGRLLKFNEKEITLLAKACNASVTNVIALGVDGVKPEALRSYFAELAPQKWLDLKSYMTDINFNGPQGVKK